MIHGFEAFEDSFYRGAGVTSSSEITKFVVFMKPIHLVEKARLADLIYTVAFDPPGWRGGRTMAKLLCSSLLRHFWSGERKMADSHVFNGTIGPAEELIARRNTWMAATGNGINAGTFAVRAECYAGVMNYWREIFESAPPRHEEMRDQTAWNRLLLDTELRAKPFERGEVRFPFHLDAVLDQLGQTRGSAVRDGMAA